MCPQPVAVPMVVVAGPGTVECASLERLWSRRGDEEVGAASVPWNAMPTRITREDPTPNSRTEASSVAALLRGSRAGDGRRQGSLIHKADDAQPCANPVCIKLVAAMDSPDRGAPVPLPARMPGSYVAAFQRSAPTMAAGSEQGAAQIGWATPVVGYTED
jgi:hypothetical protein